MHWALGFSCLKQKLAIQRQWEFDTQLNGINKNWKREIGK